MGGGKSLRTIKGHREVWSVYEEVLQKYKDYPGKLSSTAKWDLVAQKTEYSPDSVRHIISKFLKTHTADYKGNCKPLKI